MDARVIQVDGGAGDGGAQFVRDRVVPALRDSEGREGILHVADRGNGRGYSITFWRDSESLEATNDTAARLREEAQGEGYDVSLVGQFRVAALQLSGGDPRVARFVRTRGGPEIGQWIRDTIAPAYEGSEGYLGVIGLAGEDDRGIGISLWASDEAYDAAEDAMKRLGQAMRDAGFEPEGVERLAVETAQLPSG